MKQWLIKISPALFFSLGLVFIFSAVAKALEIESFEVQIAFYGLIRTPWVVKTAAAAMIAIETMAGLALVLGMTLRGWTSRLVMALLLAFTGLIIYGWGFKGLTDCGCFGSMVKMTPGVTIAKNLVMMAMVAAGEFGLRARSRRWVGEPQRGGFKRVAQGIVGLLCLGAVVVALGVGYRQGKSGGDSVGSDPPPEKKDAPFARFRFEAEGIDYDLGRGEYLVALLSDSCDHCEEAVPQLNELADLLGESLPPIVGLCLGEKETLAQFRERSGPQFPTVLIEPLIFFDLIGDAPPRFILIRDGRPLQSWDEELPDAMDLLDLIESGF
jgi:uncharacterized membrane protein YphA (DoxX/SURF4 family)